MSAVELNPPFTDFSPDNPECKKLFQALWKAGADCRESYDWMLLMGGVNIEGIEPISDEFFDILKRVSPEWYEWTELWFF